LITITHSYGGNIPQNKAHVLYCTFGPESPLLSGKGFTTKKAPEGATRCQVFARGISLYLFGSRAADQQWSLV